MILISLTEFYVRQAVPLPGRPPVGELKKVGKSRIFWQKVGKSREDFSQK